MLFFCMFNAYLMCLILMLQWLIKTNRSTLNKTENIWVYTVICPVSCERRTDYVHQRSHFDWSIKPSPAFSRVAFCRLHSEEEEEAAAASTLAKLK